MRRLGDAENAPSLLHGCVFSVAGVVGKLIGALGWLPMRPEDLPAPTSRSPEPAPASDRLESSTQAADPADPAPGSPGRSGRKHWARVLVALISSTLLVVLFSFERRVAGGTALGLVLALTASLALTGLCSRNLLPSTAIEPAGQELKGPLAWLLGVSVMLVLTLSAAVKGSFATWPMPGASPPLRQALLAGGLVTGLSLTWMVCGFRVLQTLGVYGPTRLRQRHGFWLLLLITVLYLPMLGNFALIDPWETHYGEVAREMVVRQDWISLWWAHDGWFFSKPILNFWMQALSFSLLGMPVEAGQMIAGMSEGRVPQPEWAVRLPVFMVTLASTYGLYRSVAQLASRRLGLLAALVLASMPYWYLLGHQSMADMPYVAPLSLGMGLLACAVAVPPERGLRRYHATLFNRPLAINAYQAFLVALLLIALPQILYLVSLHWTLHWSPSLRGFRLHWDELMAGSPGNCHRSGNQACHQVKKLAYPLYQPGYLACLWLAGLGHLLYRHKTEWRLQRLLFLTAWLLITLAFMAKGAPALALPLAVLLAHTLVTRRLSVLRHAEWSSLGLIVGVVAAPWIAQMFARHGSPFIDRLFLHDMVQRAFSHVHDTNGDDDTSFRYYLWQLGYGLFPWVGLAAAGLLTWNTRAAQHTSPQAEKHLVTAMLLWAVAGFSLFTLAGTKFHHYALPLAPPLAVFVARILDRALGPRAAISLIAATNQHLTREPELEANLDRARQDSARLAVLGLASAVAVLLVGRDLRAMPEEGVEGSMRLLHLVAYNYDRPWPEGLDFSATLWAFSLLAALGCTLLVIPSCRRFAAVALLGLGCSWTAWGLYVYLPGLAPHWSQRDAIATYYKARTGPDEPLIAYQMNWKGENFYTGNALETWTRTGKKFKDWVASLKGKDIHTIFVITEHSRVASVERDIKDEKSFAKLTDKASNNKFVLVRVEL